MTDRHREKGIMGRSEGAKGRFRKIGREERRGEKRRGGGGG